MTAELPLESSFLEPRFLWENSYGKKIARYLVSQLDDCIEATPKGGDCFPNSCVCPPLSPPLIGGLLRAKPGAVPQQCKVIS